jgi:hypothetical protein
MVRPSISVLLNALSAAVAVCSSLNVTKPKPLERPVARSKMTRASVGPNCAK